MIKKAKINAGPSGTIPGVPRAPASAGNNSRSSGSRIDSDENQGSEEGELLSEEYDSTESESDGTEYSDIESKKPPATSAAALHKQLHRYIQQERDKGGDGLDVVVDQLIIQERKQAKLEHLLSAQRPG